MRHFAPTGLLAAFVSLASLVAACAPSGALGPAGAARAPGEAEQAAPKILRIAFIEEPDALYGGTSSEKREQGDIFNAGLTFFDGSGTLLPKLAVKVPSIADGDWKTAADGSMEVTWKLKPNLKWHDGAPLHSQDFAFTVRMFKDPGSPWSVPRSIRFVDEVLTPDAETLVLRYRTIFTGAAVADTPAFPPVPRHLLGDQYEQVGIEGLTNSPIFTTQWVGLGPFRLVDRTLGSHLEAEAFSDYVLGRPKIDRLIIRYIFDVNAVVANLLAGELDGVTTGSLEAIHGADLKRQWESAGRGSVGVVKNRLRQMQLQFRDPALPWASDVRVRQAALHLIDRQAMVDSIIHGLSEVAHIATMTTSPVYGLVERRGLARYPLDPTQADRLLAAAGWSRGPDGVRRNAEGAVFTWNPAVSGTPDLPETLVIVDGFKAAGISSEPDIIPDTLSSNVKNERRGRAHSITRSAGLDDSYWDRFGVAQISRQENRWRGANTGGHTSTSFEGLFDQWRVTIDPGPRSEKEAEMHKLLLDELAYLPLFYNVDVFAFRKGVDGPKANMGQGRNNSFDIQTWTIS